MSDKKYKVIVCDRVKQMLGAYIRFMTQVNKDAAKAKNKELMDAMCPLDCMLQHFLLFEEAYIPINIIKCLSQSVISFFIKSKMMRLMWIISLITVKITFGLSVRTEYQIYKSSL